MNSHPIEKTHLFVGALGVRHGYRFDGGAVLLTSSFQTLHASARHLGWSLQLRASVDAPASREDLADAFVVAAAPLPPFAEIADTEETFTVEAPAALPAGDRAWFLSLALVRADSGAIEDFAAYARPESFCGPRLRGTASFALEGSRVRLAVDEITNPRATDNVSGTLALELWALAQPYAGAGFDGLHLGGVVLGSLHGGNAWTGNVFELDAALPLGGQHHFVLMLREWNGAAYETRDFVNFPQPVSFEAPAAPAEVPAEIPAAAAPKAGNKAKAPAAKKEPAPTKKAAQPKAKTAPAAKTTQVEPAGEAPVSLNEATPAELQKIQGLSAKVIDGIVASRPFASVEELLKVKGMGARLLARIRGNVKL